MRTFFLLLSFCVGACAVDAPRENDFLAVSAPAQHLRPGERIVAFKLTAFNGFFLGMPVVPRGWSVTVNNDEGPMSEVSGGARYGAAALDEGYFRSFVTVRKNDIPSAVFDIKIRMSVTADFEHERWIESIPLTTPTYLKQ